ncbi:MAG: DJ-1/PfpI family protein [Candidatus Bathyarchaeota archaeon]|nr:MAG: DJ-1/PfpI family protein [Candidatus Bathyarchaeota archaeon]
MIKALVFLATGFEEIEAVTIVDILRRGNIAVTTAGITPNPIEGAHKLKIIPDKYVEEIFAQEFDAIICPGGAPGYKNLRIDSRVIHIIKNAYNQNKLVAAICAAPAVLSDAGILENKKCTIYPGMENELIKGKGKPKPDNVVVDGRIVTSKGPATALEFALKLVEMLSGKHVADSVAKQVLANYK